MILSNLTDRGTLRGTLSRGANGSTVSITPLYNTGVDICIYTIDGVEGHIFIPDMSTDVEINPVSFQDPKTKIADYRINNTNGSIYIPKDEVIGNASGDVASFPDGAEEPIKSIDILISAASSEAVVTKCGKNLYNKNSDYYGEELFWATGTGTLIYSNTYYGSPKIPIKPNTTYKRNVGATANIYFNKNGDYITYQSTGQTFTSPNNAYYVAFNIPNTVPHDGNMLIFDNTDLNFEPYIIPTPYLIPLPTIISDGFIHIEYNGSWSGYIYDNSTSTTYTIQPEAIPHIITLYGYNNIWSDTGDIDDLKYIVSNRIFLQMIHDSI